MKKKGKVLKARSVAEPDDQAVPAPDEMVVAPESSWFPTSYREPHEFGPEPHGFDPEPPLGLVSQSFFGNCSWSQRTPPAALSPPIFHRTLPNPVKSIPSTPRASIEVLVPSLPTSTIISPPRSSIDLPQVSTSCPPELIPAGSSVPTAHLHLNTLDPVTRTVVLISGISATLSARLQPSHQSLLDPIFQAFVKSVLKTRPVIVADEVKALLNKYATGFNYDGIQQVREEMTQAFMHNWVQMGLGCATSAKEILSKDICESINKQLRGKYVKSILGETLLETVKLTLDQCLARAHERIKELAQDHIIIIHTHDCQTLAREVDALRDQIFRGAQVSDHVRTIASEVYAYFNISSREFIDGCIRTILRQLMHELSLRLSSELFGALKLSEADLPERCRIWVQ